MIKRRFKPLLNSVIGSLGVGLLHATKLTKRRGTANAAGSLARKIGPLLKEHRTGRENLHAAFPEKSPAEIETILAGVWDNLGRLGVEFAHLDEFSIAGVGTATLDSICYSPQTKERAERIIAQDKAIICFAAHLANWELPALGAKLIGTQTAVLYRRPNIRAISDVVVKMRAPLMGDLVPTGLDAPVRLARLLQAGVHVGVLVDQYYDKGVEVTFFGRRCKTNPLVALLARQTGSAIHGLRVVRLADKNSFQIEVTDPVEPARDAEGRIDVAGTMQAITSVVESWVREHPEQWLWLHRRWR